jgi:hypothetical protein
LCSVVLVQSAYTKKLVLPDGFDPPRRLVHEGVVAHALTRDDLAADAYERGYYATVFDGLRHWVTNDYPFAAPHFSNARLPGLTAVARRAVLSSS